MLAPISVRGGLKLIMLNSKHDANCMQCWLENYLEEYKLTIIFNTILKGKYEDYFEEEKLKNILKTILKTILNKLLKIILENILKRMMNVDGGSGTQQEQGWIVMDQSLRWVPSETVDHPTQLNCIFYICWHTNTKYMVRKSAMSDIKEKTSWTQKNVAKSTAPWRFVYL